MNVHSVPRKPPPRPNPLVTFFADRWNGRSPLWRLFWVDMIVVGSILNVATTAIALLMLGFKAPTPLAIFVHFSPLPYNLFLVYAVWRTAQIVTPLTAPATTTGAIIWLIIATIA